jgi:hypothetical protein
MKEKQMSDLYTQSRRPTHRLYQVIGHGKKASWREIGAAWPNKDGAGFSLECTALPLAGSLVMREIKPATEGEAEPDGGQR